MEFKEERLISQHYPTACVDRFTEMNPIILFGLVAAIAFLVVTVFMPLGVTWAFEPKQKVCFDDLGDYFKFRLLNGSEAYDVSYPCPDIDFNTSLQEDFK